MKRLRKKHIKVEEFSERLAGVKGEAMQTGIFFVQLRDDLKKDFKDFFPHMSSNYISMSHLFSKEKMYPVLAVEKVVVFDQEGKETASARFLIPTENLNFIWVHSELFRYVGIEKDAPSG